MARIHRRHDGGHLTYHFSKPELTVRARFFRLSFMILEVAKLDVKPGHEKQFESAFELAQQIIIRAEGYCGHELQRCVEQPSRYILLVRWDRLEHHTVGFRQSAEYQQWRSLLHHFYDPFPKVEHYQAVFREDEQGR
jgi:heme-degrading monooxygenase HmoA